MTYTTINRRTLLVGSISLASAAIGLRNTNAATARRMILYKDPNCGCCHLWGAAMSTSGFDVIIKDVDDMTPIKARFGIAEQLQGCHTAEIDGYFLEGHVPLASVNRLLAERPEIAGLAVPGMPAGSLGMGDDPTSSYDVLAISRSPMTAPVVYDAVRTKI